MIQTGMVVSSLSAPGSTYGVAPRPTTGTTTVLQMRVRTFSLIFGGSSYSHSIIFPNRNQPSTLALDQAETKKRKNNGKRGGLRDRSVATAGL